MPHLAGALDPERAEAFLKRGLPRLSGEDGMLRLREITVLRHKPGKRCIVEYRVHVLRPGQEPERARIIGKTRAKRFGQASYRLQQAFWDQGFDARSPDHISVPEPLGHIPEMEMWFQRKVKGHVFTSLVSPSTGLELASRIADAADKIHHASVPTTKRHTIQDELRILEGCFLSVKNCQPQLANRLDALWQACLSLGESLSDRPITGIHRDFYSDQVILHKGRFYVIDFDLYCEGDPALDIGNFTAHLTEMALRLYHHHEALKSHEMAIIERFLELSGQQHRHATQVYHLLTLARHIFLSTQFEERRRFTEPLLQLCEEQFYSRRTL